MQRKGRSTSQEELSASIEVIPKIEVVTTSIFMFTSTNYRLWAMRMKVYLKVYRIGEVIARVETSQKKDH